MAGPKKIVKIRFRLFYERKILRPLSPGGGGIKNITFFAAFQGARPKNLYSFFISFQHAPLFAMFLSFQLEYFETSITRFFLLP